VDQANNFQKNNIKIKSKVKFNSFQAEANK